MAIEPATLCIHVFNDASSTASLIDTVKSLLITACHRGRTTGSIWLMLGTAAGLLSGSWSRLLFL